MTKQDDGTPAIEGQKTIGEQHAEERRASKCPVCRETFKRTFESGDFAYYVHDERSGAMGMQLITDSCRFKLTKDD